jgi:hypothetical protein
MQGRIWDKAIAKLALHNQKWGDKLISSTTVLYCLLLVVDWLVGNDVRVMQWNIQRRGMVALIRK